MMKKVGCENDLVSVIIGIIILIVIIYLAMSYFGGKKADSFQGTGELNYYYKRK